MYKLKKNGKVHLNVSFFVSYFYFFFERMTFAHKEDALCGLEYAQSAQIRGTWIKKKKIVQEAQDRNAYEAS